MKQLSFLLFFLVVLLRGFSQVPQGINYQAVVRNNQGDVVANHAIGVKFNLRQGSLGGTIVYSETHSTTSDQFGGVALVIGQGTSVSGVFANINWATGAYFNEVLIDVSGGSNYVSMGTSQLMSVPYALYAALIPFNFYIFPVNDTVLIAQGESKSHAFDFRWIDGTPQPITVSVSGVPAGVTTSFSQSNLYLPDSAQTVLSLANGNGATGVYPLTITGVCNSITKMARIYLQIICKAIFPGNYTVTEACAVAGSSNYNSTISQNGNNFSISNFGNLSLSSPVVVTTACNGTITIASQTISGYTITGQGTFTSNTQTGSCTITLNYTYVNGSTVESCTATFTKS